MNKALATNATLAVAGDASTDQLPPPQALAVRLRRHYLAVLTWAFTLFSSIRMLTYLPTVVAIVASGDSSQHSLLTWLAWTASNLTMALWLYEQNGQKANRAVGVNAGNSLMCLLTTVVIVLHRM